MKVLMVIPGRLEDGGRVRARNIVSTLRLSHDVILLESPHAKRSTRTRILAACRAARALVEGESMRRHYMDSPGLRRDFRQAISAHKPDLVILKRKRLGFLASLVPPELPVILDMTDSVSLWQSRVAMLDQPFKPRVINQLDLPGTIREEANLLVDGGICRIWMSSASDIRYAESLMGRALPNAGVVPNVVDDSFLRSPEVVNPTDRVVFVADYAYATNTASANWLVFEVWPLLASRGAVRLDLVGRGARKEWVSEGLAISTVGFVEDLPGYLSASSVVVAPMIAGAGTKNKVLQALAVGAPLVTTSLGLEGINAPDLPGLFIADGPHDFAAAILLARALAPEERRRHLAGSRAFIQERFSVTALMRILDAELGLVDVQASGDASE